MMLRRLLIATAGNQSGIVTTWNPLDKHGDITISSGGLVASRNNSGIADAMVRAASKKSSGKWCFPLRVVAYGANASAIDIGIATSSASLATYLGASVYGYGYDSANGKLYNSASGANFGSAYGVGDLIEVLFNGATGELLITLNGIPANGGVPILTGFTAGAYPAVSLNRSSSVMILAAVSSFAAANGYALWDMS